MFLAYFISNWWVLLWWCQMKIQVFFLFFKLLTFIIVTKYFVLLSPVLIYVYFWNFGQATYDTGGCFEGQRWSRWIEVHAHACIPNTKACVYIYRDHRPRAIHSYFSYPTLYFIYNTQRTQIYLWLPLIATTEQCTQRIRLYIMHQISQKKFRL